MFDDVSLLTLVVAVILQVVDDVLVKAIEAKEFIDMATHKVVV